MRVVALLLAAQLSWIAPSTFAQVSTYPNRPLRILVPHVTGGMVDTVTRTLAQHMQDRLGQAVVVENRVGAIGAIAIDAVAKSPADGYTLLFGTNTNFVFLPASRKSLPYDTMRDLSSVGAASTAPMYLVVHPSLQVRSVQQLLALAKSQPGKLNFASEGIGSSQHLAMELLKSRTGVDMFHVPFKSTGPAMIDLMAGQVQLMFQGPTSTLPLIRAGKLHVVASSSPKRTQAMPEVPTVGESGIPGFDMSTWSGLMVPAGTPRPVIDRLNGVVGEMLRNPAMAQKFASSNIELFSSTPEEMDERIRRELPLFTRLMRDAGIQPE